MIKLFIFGFILCSENDDYNEENSVNLEGFSFLRYPHEDDNFVIPDIRMGDNATFFYDELIKGLLDFGNENDDYNEENSVNLEGFSFLRYPHEDDNSVIPDIRMGDNVTFFYDELIKGLLDFGNENDEPHSESYDKITNRSIIGSNTLIANTIEIHDISEYHQHQIYSSAETSFSNNEMNDFSNSKELTYNIKRPRMDSTFVSDTNNGENVVGIQYYNKISDTQGSSLNDGGSCSVLKKNDPVTNYVELPSTSRHVLDRLSLINCSPFDNALLISNVSFVDTLESQQSKLNQFKWNNIYYDMVRRITQYNYKCYEREINIYFEKVKNV